MNVEARARALDLLFGFMETQCVTAAMRLHILDALGEAPRDSDSIAREVDVDPHSARRLLRALASLGVARQVGEDQFAETEVGTILRGRLRDYGAFFAVDCYPVWTDLVDAVRTGVTCWQARHGESHFASLARDAEANARFNRAMSSSVDARIAALARHTWSDASVIVDIGGGDGALIRGLVAAHPRLRGVVFDLPHVVASEATHGGTAIERVAGDIFRDTPPPADVYLLSRVLHDWNDEDATRILTTCRRGARGTTKLLVVEHVLPDGEPGPARAHMLDLQMLVMTGGRERTEREWRALLASTGFEVVDIVRGEVSWLEARTVT